MAAKESLSADDETTSVSLQLQGSLLSMGPAREVEPDRAPSLVEIQLDGGRPFDVIGPNEARTQSESLSAERDEGL